MKKICFWHNYKKTACLKAPSAPCWVEIPRYLVSDRLWYNVLWKGASLVGCRWGRGAHRHGCPPFRQIQSKHCFKTVAIAVTWLGLGSLGCSRELLFEGQRLNWKCFLWTWQRRAALVSVERNPKVSVSLAARMAAANIHLDCLTTTNTIIIITNYEYELGFHGL